MTNAPDTTSRSPLEQTLGDRLAKALKYAGIKNEEMADALDVSRGTITNYIGDKTPIKDLYIKEWALKTGIPFEELKYGPTHTNGPTTPGGQTTDYGSDVLAFQRPKRIRSTVKRAA